MAERCGSRRRHQLRCRKCKRASDPAIKAAANSDQKLANGPTVDVATKSTQGGHLLDRNSITFDSRIQPNNRCWSRHDKGSSFGICFSSIVASPSRIARVRSGGRNASRNPWRTTFGWRSAAVARSSMEA